MRPVGVKSGNKHPSGILGCVTAIALVTSVLVVPGAAFAPHPTGAGPTRAGTRSAQQTANQGSHYRKASSSLLGLRKPRLIELAAGTLLSVAMLPAVLAFADDTKQLVVKEVTIRLPDWPAGFDGLKVVVLADFHVGSRHISLDRLSKIVERVNELKPDLVVLLGDFVNDGLFRQSPIRPEAIADKLKELRAQSAVVAVLGNHDWWYKGSNMRVALEEVGIRVLENDATQTLVNGHPIWLAGLADSWTRQPDVKGTFRMVTPGEPVIALTHNPDLFPEIPSQVKLTLAGHTHGGQIRLPLLGPLMIASNFGKRYAGGHVEQDQRHLFVTTGIGTSCIPARFRVPPEIAVLTIVAAKQSQ